MNTHKSLLVGITLVVIVMALFLTASLRLDEKRNNKYDNTKWCVDETIGGEIIRYEC